MPFADQLNATPGRARYTSPLWARPSTESPVDVLRRELRTLEGAYRTERLNRIDQGKLLHRLQARLDEVELLAKDTAADLDTAYDGLLAPKIFTVTIT